eukprot:6514246-Pyramimonas_sp.AAC.1
MVTSLRSFRSGLLRYRCPSPIDPWSACSVQWRTADLVSCQACLLRAAARWRIASAVVSHLSCSASGSGSRWLRTDASVERRAMMSSLGSSSASFW